MDKEQAPALLGAGAVSAVGCYGTLVTPTMTIVRTMVPLLLDASHFLSACESGPIYFESSIVTTVPRT